MNELDDIERRISLLESPPICSDEHKRVKQACENLSLAHKFIRVPSNYYEATLNERVRMLGGLKKESLCKCILLKNCDCDSQYYMVIVQYVHQIEMDCLVGVIRRMLGEPKQKLGLQLAPPAEAAELTGFGFNSVSPLGLLNHVPIIMAKSILQNKCMYLGGGEVDLKLKVNVEQFVKVASCVVADISESRQET